MSFRPQDDVKNWNCYNIPAPIETENISGFSNKSLKLEIANRVPNFKPLTAEGATNCCSALGITESTNEDCASNTFSLFAPLSIVSEENTECVSEVQTKNTNNFFTIYSDDSLDTKIKPKNKSEGFEILKQNFYKTIDDLYNWDPSLVLTMFGSATFLVLGSGIMYAIGLAQKTRNVYDQKLVEHSSSSKEEFKRQDKKMEEIKASTKEDISRQDKRMDEVVARLEKQVKKGFERLEGSKDAKVLELQHNLLVQTVETIKRQIEEEKLRSQKSDAIIFVEQERALRASMERYSERIQNELPKRLAQQLKEFQKVTDKFKSYVLNSDENITESKIKEEMDKLYGVVEAETTGFAKQMLEAIKPRHKYIGGMVRRFRR